MAEQPTKPLPTVLLFIILKVLGICGQCSSSSTAIEKAYVGTYDIRYPDTYHSATCRWKIVSYRKDYVIQLEFYDVILDTDNGDHSCVEEITVYDGPQDTNNKLATFCGREEPKIVTSSQEALVVFSSQKSSPGNGTFKFKYKAVKERPSNGDTSQILRIAFGGFIGSIALLVVCSGVFRKYKQSRSSRGFFLFGRHRVNTSGGNGHGSGTTSGGGIRETRAATQRGTTQGQQPERKSFRKRMAGFFQDFMVKLTSRRFNASSTSESSDSSSQENRSSHQGSRAVRHPRRGSISTTDGTHISNVRSSSSNNEDGEMDDFTLSQYHLDDSMLGMGEGSNGHMNFGYQNIPITSFTSDPDAVRPPTYEDCINNVNPLYLHHHSGQAFYNRAFDMKDEETEGGHTLSPPPPYSEVNQDTGTAPRVVSSHNDNTDSNSDPDSQPPNYQASSLGQNLTSRSENNGDTSTTLTSTSLQEPDPCLTLTPVSITQERSSLPQVTRSPHEPVNTTSLQNSVQPPASARGTDRDRQTQHSEKPEIPAADDNVTSALSIASILQVNSTLDQQVTNSSRCHVTDVSTTGFMPLVGSRAPVELLRRTGFIPSLAEDANMGRRVTVASKEDNGKNIEDKNADKKETSTPEPVIETSDELAIAPTLIQSHDSAHEKLVNQSNSSKNDDVTSNGTKEIYMPRPNTDSALSHVERNVYTTREELPASNSVHDVSKDAAVHDNNANSEDITTDQSVEMLDNSAPVTDKDL